ncbi:Alpha-galactosidase [Blautia producta]|uniref:Alpha-galactosidase n=1 Tax=Blautia producta TaxID=33035 RepID=A0A4P6LXM6_9FIRM|nr:glycoside hydrolase family 36 protein [Blautia producta]QBE97354.1 Alpha-galactosidase [Blautia producta]
MREVKINENGLSVVFRIRNNGVVELQDFSPLSLETKMRKMEYIDENIYYPLLEVRYTGATTTEMHGFKHNVNSSSLEFVYERHEFNEYKDGKELKIFLDSKRKVSAVYHMKFFHEVPVVKVWTELENHGVEMVGLEYISSFMYQGISSNGVMPYYKKTDIYVPNNSWSCEAQWQKYDAEKLNLNGMAIDGFNSKGFSLNRFYYGGRGSWSSCEYLPMGFAADRETGETYLFQIENSGQWHVEYGSGEASRLYLALSGPEESDHGWWKNLKPGNSFVTVPAAFGVVKGDINAAVAALTRYRRKVRRKNQDNERLNVVFNDYMNCLMGDPTEEKVKQIIDKIVDLGCEYYCLDAGWYDDGYWWDRVGEWMESSKRFPNGLKTICDYANSKGMKMGLWLEIEVMGTSCELAEKLPDDWFICRHGKRHIDNKRYLLDFRNPKVRKHCRMVIERLIRDYGVDYFKMDYNVSMGYGSDINSDSCADAILEHYRCLYQWYEEIFESYPALIIENCSSGGQRMDYGMLKLLSLQSVSDQTDYIYNSYIATNAVSAVTPEQAGIWVYPYEDEAEHVVYNMVNGLLHRPYISGMVWKLGTANMVLLREGIALYKQIRSELKEGEPFFPLGFAHLGDPVLAYGVKTRNCFYLSVLMPDAEEATIPLDLAENVKNVSVIYPRYLGCSYEYLERNLKVHMPQKKTGRLFKFELD